jgi:soluble lytic murein transglycosylase-like protein
VAGRDPGLGRAVAGAAQQVASAAARKVARKGVKRVVQAAVGTSSAGTSIAVEAGLRAAKPIILWSLALLAVLLTVAVFVIVGATAASGSAAAGPDTMTCAIADASVPEDLTPIYAAAAARFGLGPRGPAVLSAINRVETSFGRHAVTSSAGAVGWMQFMPDTWSKGAKAVDGRIVVPPTTDDRQGYATDGDDDGVADTADPDDAIHSAARYLHASGAPGNWHDAIYAYNNSEDYVSTVLAYADTAAGGACTTFAADAPLTSGSRARLLPDGTAAAPEDAPQRVKAMIAAANQIAHRPYVYGGGHGSATPTGTSPSYDCSSAVSWVLYNGGLLRSTVVAHLLESWGAPLGTGETGGWVVVYANDGHTWMTIAGLVFDNYGSRGSRSMWSDHVVERVGGYAARRPLDEGSWT